MILALSHCLHAGMKTQAVLHAAARAVAHVAHCVEFFRGSRVEDYQPLCQLLSKLASPALLMPIEQSVPGGPTAGLQVTAKNSIGPQAAANDEDGSVAASKNVIPEVQEFVAASLSEQALRLLQALVAGHDQVLPSVSSTSGLLTLTGLSDWNGFYGVMHVYGLMLVGHQHTQSSNPIVLASWHILHLDFEQPPVEVLLREMLDIHCTDINIWCNDF